MIDAYVASDSLSALAAALDLAEVGLKVRVGITNADIPQRALPDAEGTLAALCERLAAPVAEGGPRHEHLSPVTHPPHRTALRGRGGAWSAAPTPSVLGIPAVPLSRECTQLLGGGTAFRAYLDRITPLLTIGKTQWLDALVNARIGAKARAVLIDPVVRERFGRETADVEVSIAAPGLNETMSRTGSLTGAVLAYAERNVARETRVAPQAGWGALREALIERLALYSVEVVAERVVGVTRVGDGADEEFHLTCEATADGPSAPDRVSVTSDTQHSREIVARSLVIDVPEMAPAYDAISRAADDTQNMSPGSSSLLHALEASHLVPSQHRVYAEIGIHAPEWTATLDTGVPDALGSDPAKADPVASDAMVDSALRTVAAARHGSARGDTEAVNAAAANVDAGEAHARDADTAEVWSVRVHLSGEAAPRAALRGPVVDAAHGESMPDATSTEALEHFLQRADIEIDPDAAWHVRWEAAPHATHADRERQRDALDTFRATHPTVLPVGAALHGGDRSSALAHSANGAVELRRQLLGLTA